MIVFRVIIVLPYGYPVIEAINSLNNVFTSRVIYSWKFYRAKISVLKLDGLNMNVHLKLRRLFSIKNWPTCENIIFKTWVGFWTSAIVCINTEFGRSNDLEALF